MLESLTTKDTGRQVIRLGLIGVLNTVDYLILFNIFRTIGISRYVAVTAAFAIATFVSYVLNRRWTFGLPENAGGAVETAKFYVVNLVAWGVTVAVIRLADLWFGPLDRIGENVASIAAGVIVLLPKLITYRDVVFGKAIRLRSADGEPSPVTMNDGSA